MGSAIGFTLIYTIILKMQIYFVKIVSAANELLLRAHKIISNNLIGNKLSIF